MKKLLLLFWLSCLYATAENKSEFTITNPDDESILAHFLGEMTATECADIYMIIYESLLNAESDLLVKVVSKIENVTLTNVFSIRKDKLGDFYYVNYYVNSKKSDEHIKFSSKLNLMNALKNYHKKSLIAIPEEPISK